MSDELTVLLLVASRIDGAGIPYMVSGSMAMNYYARPRMMRDIDLVVALEEKDSARIPELFPEFYCDLDDVLARVAERITDLRKSG